MALAELGRFKSVEAQILVGRLRSEGIDAVAFDVGLDSVYSGLALLGGGVRVMVDDDDLHAARRIVAAAA